MTGYTVQRRLWTDKHPGKVCPRGRLGCPSCWSTRFWRLCCVACTWVSAWTDGKDRRQNRDAHTAWEHHRQAHG